MDMHFIDFSDLYLQDEDKESAKIQKESREQK